MSQPIVDLIRGLSGTDDVEMLSEATPAVVAGVDSRDELRPRSIVRINSMYLVEVAPDEWYMGALDRGVIVCWGMYGRLEDAVRAR